jgi:lipopolysaccharide transport system permease protein
MPPERKPIASNSLVGRVPIDRTRLVPLDDLLRLLLTADVHLATLRDVVGVIDGFRWCIRGGDSRIYWPGFWLRFLVAGFFLWFGVRRFRKVEKDFADLI